MLEGDTTFAKLIAKICERERVDIKQEKKGKMTQSDTLRLQDITERNWDNLEKQVGRMAGTISEYI